MTALARITNPIEWQETQHQHRSIPLFLRRWWMLAPLAMLVTLGVIVYTLRDITSPTRDLAIYTIWVVHTITAARAIAAGANAVSREYSGKTWTILVLTGVSVRQILLGKWFGVLNQLGPWMLALGAVRLVMLPILMLSLINRFAWRTIYSTNNGPYFGLGDSQGIYWVAWAAVVAVVMTLVLTMLEVMSCAALGLAASAVAKRGWVAMVGAIIIRFMPVALFAAFTRYEVGTAPAWRILSFPALSLADSGSAALYQLILPSIRWTRQAHVAALPGVMMATLLLLLLLAGSLIVAWWAIRQAGALPKPIEEPVALEPQPV